MEDYTRYQLDELYNILSQVQQAIELLEEEEKKKNKWVMNLSPDPTTERATESRIWGQAGI